jgi:hypothetical protein
MCSPIFGFKSLLPAVFAALLAMPVQAQHHEGHAGMGGPHGGPQGGPGWHGGSQHFEAHGGSQHFEAHGRGVWDGGHWHHGPHDGHDGWWWVVGPSWYYYPAPIYPYPDLYGPPVIAPPSSAFWFYCPSAGAYYPYVDVCPGGWIQVPATP